MLSKHASLLPRLAPLFLAARTSAPAVRYVYRSYAAAAAQLASSPSDKPGALENFRISQERVRVLQGLGITELFEIQAHTFDNIFDGKDIIARARTGSGKTLGFALPIIEKLAAEKAENGRLPKSPRAIVMAPTRELAKQVAAAFEKFGPDLSCACIYGGAPYGPQVQQLRGGVNVLVATPGRLMDMIERGDVKLNEVKFVILDEADEMMRVGFKEQVDDILTTAPDSRQTILFSATMPPWVKKMCKSHLKDPVVVDLVGNSATQVVSEVKHLAIEVPNNRTAKQQVLADVLSFYKHERCIVFTATKREADELANCKAIRQECQVLHGDIAQQTREFTLNGFREGNFPVLIATDVAARGIDVPEIDLVIQYDFPEDTEGYVHRSGRTGRAGRSGIAIVLFKRNEKRNLLDLGTQIGRKFEVIQPPAPAAIAKQAAMHAAELVTKVAPSTSVVFHDAANALLEGKDPEDVVGAALAVIAGYQNGLAQRSMLTMELGMQTIKFEGVFRSRMQALGVLNRSMSPETAVNIGRVELVEDGAVFDVKESEVAELLKLPGFSEVHEMPEVLQEEGSMSADRFGLRDRGDRGDRGDRDGRGRGEGRGRSGGFGSRGGRDDDRGRGRGDRSGWERKDRGDRDRGDRGDRGERRGRESADLAEMFGSRGGSGRGRDRRSSDE